MSHYSIFLKLAVFLIIAPEILAISFKLVYDINSYKKYRVKYSVFLPVAIIAIIVRSEVAIIAIIVRSEVAIIAIILRSLKYLGLQYYDKTNVKLAMKMQCSLDW